MSERLSDYFRVETNPAVTINSIYNHVKDYYNQVMDFISEKVQDFDVESFVKTFSDNIPINNINGGDIYES